MSELRLLIFGDICPVSDTNSAFCSGVPEYLMSKEILKLIQKSDAVIGNLECAITDSPTPIDKTGPTLYSSSKSIETLSNAGFSALSLANNHIRDCGSKAVDNTISVCNKYGIQTFGAGNTLLKAKEPLIISIKGLKIAFLSFAEWEFNAVSKESSGASIFDPISDINYIQRVKKDVDYLIILNHGGIEYHPYPSPLLQKRCRNMADAGADVILCQHSHCIGTYEVYKKSTILYGQGNSIFGYRNNNFVWNNGLLVTISIKDSCKVNFIPCQTSNDHILYLSKEDEAKEILHKFHNDSANILSEDFITKEWIRFCKESENLYIPLLMGWNRYLIALNRILKGIPAKILYNRHKRNIIHNLIRCEAHNEVVQTILGQSAYK